jgi:hypothetical protein
MTQPTIVQEELPIQSFKSHIEQLSVISPIVNPDTTEFDDYLGNVNKISIDTTNKYVDYLEQRPINGLNSVSSSLSRYIKDEIEEFDKNSNWWGEHEY